MAIVYVLSRTGERDAAIAQAPMHRTTSIEQQQQHAHMRSGSAPEINGVINTYPEPAQIQATPVYTSTITREDSEISNTVPIRHTGLNPYLPPSQQQSSTSGTTTYYAPNPQDADVAACPPCAANQQDNGDLLGKLRAEALSKTTPHIIECAAAEAGKSQDACHLPARDRYAALGQKGATLWMTGCSGAGKTTIATALEEKLVKLYGKNVYRLDGDNLRTGLNRDLGFSEADRGESVRRTGELATLFADAGVITLVGLISPYRADRDAVRQRHIDNNIPFYEVFLDVPVDELKKRDPKGQYARVESGELKHFTCIDDPYEEPLNPEITLKTHELQIEQSVELLFRRLERDGILFGAPKISPPGLPNPEGDVIVDLHVPDHLKAERRAEAETLPKVLLTDIDLNWLQTVGEGWASPLTGFMREGALLETLHFNSILTDPFNLTGSVNRLTTKTDFATFPDVVPPNRVSMPIPITLSCTTFTKSAIEESGKSAVALVTQMGQTVAILRNPEIYANRKEEIVTRLFGVIDMGHPYIKNIYKGGDYLIGGEVELLDRIRYNDGLDQWRKTATELMAEFQAKGADTVYAFQTRNPTHSGHAYLMRAAGEDLKAKGYKKPVLWLSPLGGWTKSDDVPLDVRVLQHEEVLKAGISHPGGLDPDSTVMAIWPAPMLYAGPTEVQFHAKSRRSAGASYFVVGRDPAGMKGSSEAVAHQDDDLYDGDHGRYVLQNSPGLGDMKMLSFVKVMYDITDNEMKIPDENRINDFISISGSKMRLLARNGATPCSRTNIPTDLVAANCVPAGFMVPGGWAKVVDYYKHIDEDERWIPYSQPILPAPANDRTTQSGRFGSKAFKLISTEVDSQWHDIPFRPFDSSEQSIVHMVTEIPMYHTPKMEIQKNLPNNPIMQDVNKDGSSRFYTYGVPFFNYGLIPQTWEDPDLKSKEGYGGDNDPLDIIELGSTVLQMGSVTKCRVLGSFELIDEGETDHKILCLALSDPDAKNIHSLDDLERVKPGHIAKLKDWLKRYKTSDGKPENSLASESPRTATEALAVIEETHERWKKLCGKDGTSKYSLSTKVADIWLDSPECRGVN
jgi:3'-phosphoadenosine 5'-phosphosulfate synthase